MRSDRRRRVEAERAGASSLWQNSNFWRNPAVQQRRTCRTRLSMLGCARSSSRCSRRWCWRRPPRMPSAAAATAPIFRGSRPIAAATARSSNRLTLATFDARWIAMSCQRHREGQKQDKAMADRLRAEDRERYRAFGKLLAEIKADVDVSGTNGCGALRRMLSAEVQLLPEHASKVRQYLRTAGGQGHRHATHGDADVRGSALASRVDDARGAPIPHTRCRGRSRPCGSIIVIVQSEYSCPAAAADTTTTRPRAPRTPRARATPPAPQVSRARPGPLRHPHGRRRPA